MNSLSNYYFLFRSFIVFISIFYIQFCAVIKPPSGGPKDTTPPYLVGVDPPSGSLNYKGQEIVLKFSEYMDSNSIEKGIRIFPILQNDLSIISKGEIVIIDLPDDLEIDQTYVINLSRDIKDEHGVELSDAISLAYSTGDKISKGSISGIVYSEEKSSVHLWQIKNNNLEDIYFTNPTYVTDVSNNGVFTFQYLSNADYLILCLDRNFAGMLLNENRMKFGLNWNKMISVEDDEIITNINMLMGNMNHQLKLLNGEWKGNNWARILFNRSLKNLNKDYQLKIVHDNKIINVSNSFIDPEDESSLIFIDPLLETKPENFKVFVNNLYIDKKIYIDSSSVNFSFSDFDTSLINLTSPKTDITISPNNLNEGEFVELKFSKPIPSNNKTVYQLFKNDTIQVKEKLIIVSPMQVNIMPINNWESETNYLLKIHDNILQDSTIELKINTEKLLRYGGLKIPIEGEEISSIGASLLNVENKELKKLSFVNSQKELHFNQVSEGRYTITIFNDYNNGNKYSFGTVKPLVPAEWFYMIPDTIEIRGNWDIELPMINVEKLHK